MAADKADQDRCGPIKLRESMRLAAVAKYGNEWLEVTAVFDLGDEGSETIIVRNTPTPRSD